MHFLLINKCYNIYSVLISSFFAFFCFYKLFLSILFIAQFSLFLLPFTFLFTFTFSSLFSLPVLSYFYFYFSIFLSVLLDILFFRIFSPVSLLFSYFVVFFSIFMPFASYFQPPLFPDSYDRIFIASLSFLSSSSSYLSIFFYIFALHSTSFIIFYVIHHRDSFFHFTSSFTAYINYFLHTTLTLIPHKYLSHSIYLNRLSTHSISICIIHTATELSINVSLPFYPCQVLYSEDKGK